jgi:hypothetical protein
MASGAPHVAAQLAPFPTSKKRFSSRCQSVDSRMLYRLGYNHIELMGDGRLEPAYAGGLSSADGESVAATGCRIAWRSEKMRGRRSLPPSVQHPLRYTPHDGRLSTILI